MKLLGKLFLTTLAVLFSVLLALIVTFVAVNLDTVYTSNAQPTPTTHTWSI